MSYSIILGYYPAKMMIKKDIPSTTTTIENACSLKMINWENKSSWWDKKELVMINCFEIINSLSKKKS